MKISKEHWVVVVDDSNCTVGVGGEGYLWKAKQSPIFSHCYQLEGVGSPYSKSIFRDATEEEVEKWLKDKMRADVPLNNKPKLYCGNFFPPLFNLGNFLENLQ